MSAQPASETITRPAAVAGSFYPEKAALLSHSLQDMLQQVRSSTDFKEYDDNPTALIVPHAGYVYSGRVAANAYARIPSPETIKRVLILGPAHRVSFRGVAVPTCNSFATPLGMVTVDSLEISHLLKLDLILEHDGAHRDEHSIEVQLPYLQQVLQNFEVLPLLVGDVAPQSIALLIDEIMDNYRLQNFNDDEILIVISSDLSHYHEYDTAIQKDLNTCRAICEHSHNLHGDDACGCRAINGFMLSQTACDLDIACVELCNSGDTAGGKDRVVGYGAFAFTPTDHPLPFLSHEEKKMLIQLARRSIENHLSSAQALQVDEVPDSLQRRHCSFVSLYRHGKLRGCMGALRAYQPLYLDVIEHAHAAAFRDYRYPPLKVEELKGLNIEIAVLTPEVPIEFSSERDLLKQLQPGLDGLSIQAGHHQATFLPVVWKQLATAEEFLLHLKQKAGLTVGAWPEGIKAWRYRTLHLSEDEFR